MREDHSMHGASESPASLRERWASLSPSWIRFARTPGHDLSFELLNRSVFLELLPPPGRAALVADASELPFEDGAFDLVYAFIILMDVDDLDGAIAEAARVLEPGGCFVAALREPVPGGGFVPAQPAAERGRAVPFFLHLRARKP